MIDSFRGNYDFLSNFYQDVEFPIPVETLFQSYKATTVVDRAYVLSSPLPSTAKHRGKEIELRKDWDAVKLDVMERLLRFKFSHPFMKMRLMATGDEELVEGNVWGDVYWGVCNGVGENHLGKLLMKIRREMNEAK